MRVTPTKATALLAYTLAQNGILVASGGGPGAMEATHLGALFSKQSPKDLESAIMSLASCPALPPNATALANPDGTINLEIAKALHRWFSPAMRILAQFAPSAEAGVSLSVPTWLYGHEPTTPFATSIAKYFQNSLREDGLVTLAQQGIIYTEGKAGTLQEIFQDAAQNYYGTFYPMVFLNPEGTQYWSTDFPV